MKKTVVILLSDKRSGSTMFERELCKHPDISHIDYCPHSYNETHHWLKAAVVMGLPASMFSGAKVYRGYGSKRDARAYLIDGIVGNVPDFCVPDDARELGFNGWDALCEKFATPVFFEKSPQHLAQWGALSLMLEWAQTTNYHVKFIGLIRNPLGVMYSAQQLFGTDPDQRQHGWAETQRNLMAFRQLVDPAQYCEIRYEDLIEDSLGNFAKVCDFIGVGTDKSIGEKVHGNSLNKAKDDPRFGLQLDFSTRQIAQHFGYSVDDLANKHTIEVRKSKGIGPSKAGRAILKLRDRWARPFLMRIKQKRTGGK